MKNKIFNKKYIFPILLFMFLGILVPWKMINKVYEELSPEGRYENYKVYILDSVEKWVKDRDNKFYNEENVIYWYENPDKKGNKPMDKFPPIIYQEIKNSLLLTFNEYKAIKEPDSLKKIISEFLNLKKDNIIEKLKVHKYE